MRFRPNILTRLPPREILQVIPARHIHHLRQALPILLLLLTLQPPQETRSALLPVLARRGLLRGDDVHHNRRDDRLVRVPPRQELGQREHVGAAEALQVVEPERGHGPPRRREAQQAVLVEVGGGERRRDEGFAVGVGAVRLGDAVGVWAAGVVDLQMLVEACLSC
jgi:hypothetical protein